MARICSVLRGEDLANTDVYKGKCTQHTFLLNPIKHPAYLAEMVQSPPALAVTVLNSPPSFTPSHLICVGPPPQLTDKLFLKVASGPAIKFVHTSEAAHYWTLDTWYDLRVNQPLPWK